VRGGGGNGSSGMQNAKEGFLRVKMVATESGPGSDLGHWGKCKSGGDLSVQKKGIAQLTSINRLWGVFRTLRTAPKIYIPITEKIHGGRKMSSISEEFTSGGISKKEQHRKLGSKKRDFRR